MILFQGKLIPIKIEPKQLEDEYPETVYRKQSKPSVNQFRTNGRRIFDKLSKTYGIRYFLVCYHKPGRMIARLRADHEVGVRFECLNIFVTAFAETKRRALKKLVFKVHRIYTKSIVELQNV